MFAPLNLKFSRNAIIILMYGFILTNGLTAFGKEIQASPSPFKFVALEEFDDDDFANLNVVVPVQAFYTTLPTIDLIGASKTSARSVGLDILHQTGPPHALKTSI